MFLKILGSLVLSSNVLVAAGINTMPESKAIINKTNFEKQQDILVNIEAHQQVKKVFANRHIPPGSKDWNDNIKNEFILHDFKNEGLSNNEEIQKLFKEITFNPNLIYSHAKGEEVQEYQHDETPYQKFDSGLKTNQSPISIQIKDIVVKDHDDQPPQNTLVAVIESNFSFETKFGYAHSHSIISLEIYFKEETKLYCKVITNYDLTTYYKIAYGPFLAWSNLYLETYSTNGTALIVAY